VLAEEFGVVHFVNVDVKSPRYNIAPGQVVEAVVQHGAEKRLGPMRWGFTSSSAQESKIAPINARAETIATTPLFRDAFRRRRCLIVADGFYEWRKEGARKTPHFIRLRNRRPFGLAGIWCFDRTAVGTRVATCAIVTCAANELMAQIHDRMPVIVPAPAHDQWLDANATPAELGALLIPLAADEMEAYAVSSVVNSARNDSPECIYPV
jgi:putative SOS response-associated peptidase YedK